MRDSQLFSKVLREKVLNSFFSLLLNKNYRIMELKIYPFQKINKAGIEKLESFIKSGKISLNEVVLFEKNENSYLVDFSKPCTQEFFEKVFDSAGPFWDVYAKAGLASKPMGKNYAVFICGRLYFLKNIENSFMRIPGPRKSFQIGGSKMIEIEKASLSNLTLLFALPFEAMAKSLGAVKLGLLANKKSRDFEAFRKKTLKYYDLYSQDSNIDDPLKIAKESLNLAVQSMFYSNLAFLCYIFKIKPGNSRAIQNCEMEQLKKLAKQKDFETVKKLFGFYSLAPYDISFSRFRESTLDLEMYGTPESPENYFLKWREGAKFLAARYLDIERAAYLKLGRLANLNNLIFYLKTSEMENADFGDRERIIKLKNIAETRRVVFEKCRKIELPSNIVYHKGKLYRAEEVIGPETSKRTIRAVSVSKEKEVVGPAININSFDDYKKFSKGSIIISKGLSPNLIILYRRALGIVSESGGALSHAAIVAREMGIPCLLLAKFQDVIKDGQFIRLDGKTGKITVLDQMESKIAETKNFYSDKRADSLEYDEEFYMDYGKGKFFVEEEGKEIFSLDSELSNVFIAGSKALNLARLAKSYPVPGGFILGKGFFRRISQLKEVQNLNGKIIKASSEDISGIENLSKAMKNIILALPFSPDFESELKYNLLKLSTEAVAVRSSSSCEDRPEISFAGQLDTYLNVKNLPELKNAIKKCWASFYNTRAIIYRKENGIENLDLSMSVIVQKMIDSKYAGVTFTKNPSSFGTLLIEMVSGAWEDLVLGKSVPSSYALDLDSLSIVSTRVNFEFEDKKVQELGEVGLKIEKTFGKPQDIEWCIDGEDKIWILQTRPITAMRNR